MVNSLEFEGVVEYASSIFWPHYSIRDNIAAQFDFSNQTDVASEAEVVEYANCFSRADVFVGGTQFFRLKPDASGHVTRFTPVQGTAGERKQQFQLGARLESLAIGDDVEDGRGASIDIELTGHPDRSFQFPTTLEAPLAHRFWVRTIDIVMSQLPAENVRYSWRMMARLTSVTGS